MTKTNFKNKNMIYNINTINLFVEVTAIRMVLLT